MQEQTRSAANLTSNTRANGTASRLEHQHTTMALLAELMRTPISIRYRHLMHAGRKTKNLQKPLRPRTAYAPVQLHPRRTATPLRRQGPGLGTPQESPLALNAGAVRADKLVMNGL